MLVVPGRAAPTGITWWILAEDASALELELAPHPGTAEITVRPLPALDRADARAYVVATTGLAPDTAYALTGRTEDGDAELARGRTLPEGLAANVPFTIALGSCYNWPMDLEEVWRWFPPAQNRRDSLDPLRVCFFLGDQIYMDLEKRIDAEKPDSWSKPMEDAPDPWDAYLEQWRDRSYANLLRQVPSSLFLADDHELWNDYPHSPIWLPWTRGRDRATLERELRDAYDVFQACLNLDPEVVASESHIGGALLRREADAARFDVPPLSFFVLDTRLGRTRTDTPGAVRFTDPRHLDALRDWLMEPGGLGILAVGPPVFQGPGGSTDHNLADYTADYARLITALTGARKRVLILAGDIHYSRLYVIDGFDPLDRRTELRLAELTSSPLSRLKDAPGRDPPGGPDVESGVLGSSGARFRLEVTDPPMGGGWYHSTLRQTYATVGFTYRPAENMIRAVVSAWGAPDTSSGDARLVLRRTLSFPVEEP